MDKKIIISKVIEKLGMNWGSNAPSDSEQKKYKVLSLENAIAYARLWEEYHNFKVPKNPKTFVTNQSGAKVVYVELEGVSKKDWYPVWFDTKNGHLYGEY